MNGSGCLWFAWLVAFACACDSASSGAPPELNQPAHDAAPTLRSQDGGAPRDGSTDATTEPPAKADSSADAMAGGRAIDAAFDAAITLPDGAPAPLLENAVDPIPMPPNGQSLDADDKTASASIVRDANPSGSGDLIGLFATEAGCYLLLSIDDGATWRYLSASGGTPPADAPIVPATAIAQDTVGYRIHWVTFPSGAPNARYHRVALAYAQGHVTGWSWEAADHPGPAFDASRGTEVAPRIALAESVDGSGAHVLVLAGVDQPSDTEPRRLVAARTLAGARALAPAAATDWGNVTDGATGFSVLGAWSTDTAPDPSALFQFPSADPNVREHTSTISVTQLPADGSLHIFMGTMFYNDTDNHGDITRWRLVRGSSAWTLDRASSGVVVAPPNENVRPCLGNAIATPRYVWVTWGDGAGVHVGRVDASGAWTPDAIPSPDRTGGVWWYSALNVAANEVDAWLMWERNDGTSPVDSAARWDGSTWTTRDDGALFARNPSWPGGASSWATIAGRPQGVGVMAYGYRDWGHTPLHFSIHVLER